jgi:hypothetical protein
MSNMYQELVAIKFNINRSDYDECIIDTLVAPSYVVRAFAEFLAEREDESFSIKGTTVTFQDCSVVVGDSNKVLSAYHCLKGYDIPMSNFPVFETIIKDGKNQPWKLDPNFKLFEKWFMKQQLQDKYQDQDQHQE